MQCLRIGLGLFQVALLFLGLRPLGLEAAAQPNSSEQSQSESRLLAREIVAAHNVVRGQIRVSPLVWSETLAKVAQDWANTLVASGAFEHRKDNQYGENLLEASGFHDIPFQVVRAWASEAKDYQYPANTCSAVCGHYTQVVWRDTKVIGCGVAKGPNREIWVCNYAPFGNIVGERPY